MSVVIVAGGQVSLAGLLTLDEALLVLGIFVFVLGFIFVINLGLDIEEGIAFVPAALATMTLEKGGLDQQTSRRG